MSEKKREGVIIHGMSNSKKHTIMKAKNIFMTILLMMGFVAANAKTNYRYPAELALVSQPFMTYNDYENTITIYYDVQNIGDVRYRGYIYAYLDPDDGYYYSRSWVNVCPGRIKRVAVKIPAYLPNPSWRYTVMPYYELGNELYSFTTFEYFEPVNFSWYGPRVETYYVTVMPRRIRHYHRPAEFRFYYDGYRPPMHYDPHYALDPMHHTYHYHYHNGGYPVSHPEHYGPGYAPVPPTPPMNNVNATVHPNSGSSSGSMSTPANNSGASVSNGSGNGATTRPNNSNNASSSSATTRPSNTGNASSATSRPGATTDTNSNATSRPGATNNASSNVNRPSDNSSSNSTTARPNSSSSTNNNATSRPSTTSNASSNVNRPSGNSSSNSTTARPSNSNSTNNNTTARPTSSTRPSSSGNSSNRGSSTNVNRDNSSSSSSSRSGSTSGRGTR